MVLFVCGMHRSGTSAIAETLIGAGLGAGPEAELMPASFDNPRGFFENASIVRLNDQVLADADAHWLVPPDDPEAIRSLATGPLGEHASHLVRGLTGSEEVVLKDPRFCLTLPFWIEVLGDELRGVVHVFRHPQEVAASLHRRNGLPERAGHFLWSEYVTQLMRTAGELPIVGVDYAEVVSRPAETLSILESDLRTIGIDVSLTANAIDAPLRHHSHEGGSDLAPAIHSLYAMLQSGKTTLPAELGAESGDMRLGLKAALVVERDRIIAEAERDEAREVLASRVLAVEAERDEAREVLASRVLAVEAELEEGRKALEGERVERSAERQQRTQMHEAERARLRSEIDDVHGVVLATTERLERERDQAREAHRITAQELGTAQRKLRDYEGSKTAGIARNLWKVKRRVRHYRNVAREKSARASQAVSEALPVKPPAPVTLQKSDSPIVSIVIPIYGQLGMTAGCLASIAQHTTDVAYEVIVVNDCSPDDSAAWLRSCKNVRVIHNETNLGYLHSTNAGAAAAGGEYLCLLNNDTEVQPGWLSSMVGTFATHDRVGLVGAKLVYGDGTLQEGGGIVFSDASGWNFGRTGDPDAAEVGFVRDVDYCSAACVLVRKNDWDDLGGFDERYVPAYYEDTDLAFALRERGLRVLYQPKAVITHHEGASHGTDDTQGLKAHQVRNKATFESKWRTALDEQQPPGSSPRVASWRGSGGRVLVIDHEVPGADQDSGSVRMTALLQLLVERGFKVSFAPRNRYLRQPYAGLLQAMGIEILHGPEGLEDYLRDCHEQVVLALVSRPEVADELLPMVRAALPGRPLVYDMVDFHGLRMSRRKDVTNEAEVDLQADDMAALERRCVRETALTLAITDEEADLMASLEPEAKIRVLANIHRAPRSDASFADRSGLLFVGSYRHTPNRDAISWMLDEIMPAIWQQNPDLKLHIVGSDLPDELLKLDEPGVVVHGWVQHLDPVFDQVRLTLAPLRFGAGLKGKVGDSLMRGIPVVGTDIAAEGFGDAKRALMLGSTAQELADLAVILHDDEGEWQRRSELGMQLVEDLFGYGAARNALATVLDDLGIASPRP